MFGLKKKNNKYRKNAVSFSELASGQIDESNVGKLLRDIATNRAIPNAELYSFAYSCIDKIAQVCAKANLYLYSEKTKGDTEITEHEFLRLNKTKNIYGQNFKHIIYFITLNIYLYGNCYILKLRNNGKRVIQYVPLLTRNVKPVINQELGIIAYYNYTANGKMYRYEYNDVLHFLNPNPVDLNIGKRIIDVLKNVIDVDYLQLQYLKNYYTNDATPHTVLESDRPEKDFSPKYKEEMEEKWIDKFAGLFNRFRPLFLFGGLKLNRLQSTPKEANSVQEQKLIMDRIMAHLTIPKIVMSVTENLNYASASAGLKTFIDNTIIPFVELVIESTFNDFIQSEYDASLYVKFDYTFHYDKETQIRVLDMLKRNNSITVNELRGAENYGRYDDARADKLYQDKTENQNTK